MVHTPSFAHRLGNTGETDNSDAIIGIIVISLLGIAFYHWHKAPALKTQQTTFPNAKKN